MTDNTSTSKYKFDDWWRTKAPTQYYDPKFFPPWIERLNLEPQIPENYNDPIYEEEWRIMTTPTDAFPTASEKRPNVPALYEHYSKVIIPEFEKKGIMVGILIPSGDGMININTGIAFATMFKPPHRIHTVQGHNIHILRNMLVEMAIRNEDCTHLFFLDSDVIPPPFALMRLLRRDIDIACGIYSMKAPPYAPLTIMRPQRPDGTTKFNYYFEITDQLLNKTVHADATGAGCLLIKREVIDSMGPPWFDVLPQEHGLSAIGEDLVFFDRAKKEGHEIVLDLSVHCDHAVGSTSYPRIFFEEFASPGIRSQTMIHTWNKNAVLHAMSLPLYKSKEVLAWETQKKLKEEQEKLVQTPTEGAIQIEQAETVGDSRVIKK